MTSDGELLLRAILTDPTDNLSRLVFADWLEEQGQVERAYFIRSEVEIALAGGRGSSWACSVGFAQGLYREWMRKELESFGPGSWEAVYERGFIAGVIYRTTNQFLRPGVAERLFSLHPIERVVLEDRVPAGPWVTGNTDTPDDLAGCYWWHDALSSNQLAHDHWWPKQLPLPKPTYPETARIGLSNSSFYYTREEALRAASDCCTGWGRERAGLPERALTEGGVR